MYYLNNFFFFSIIGHIFETFIFFFINSNKKSGFLYLWWTPFYGIGVLISILVNKWLSKLIKNKLIKNLFLFVILFVLLSFLELCGGELLKLIYNKDFWNYSNIPLNLGKYISVPTSIVWALFSIIYLNFIKKYTDRFSNRIPKFITVILSIIFIMDLFFSIIKIL